MSNIMKENRAKASKCVRLDDKKGYSTKFTKTRFLDESRKEIYYYSVKCAEQLARGCSPTIVASKGKFQKFRDYSKLLETWRLPEGFQFFHPKKKREALEKLVNELYNELAAAVIPGPVQGVDIPADDSGSLQVGVDSTREFDKTVKEDVDMQMGNPGQIQADEVRAATPNLDFGNIVSIDASLQNFAWNQCGNPQGRPPPRPPVRLEEIFFFLNDLMLRASRFPGVLPEFHWSEEAFRRFYSQLEIMEGALMDRSGLNYRSHEVVFAPLADYFADEDVTSLPSNEILADEIWSYLDTSPGLPEAPG